MLKIKCESKQRDYFGLYFQCSICYVYMPFTFKYNNKANDNIATPSSAIIKMNDNIIFALDLFHISCVMRNLLFSICKIKGADHSCVVNAQLISAFVFATKIVQPIYFLNLKFLATSHLLSLYSPACIVP